MAIHIRLIKNNVKRFFPKGSDVFKKTGEKIWRNEKKAVPLQPENSLPLSK